MKKWKRYVPVGLLAIVFAAAALMTTDVKAQNDTDDTIPNRVYFGTISGGGLTSEEAIETIEAYVDELKDTKIVLSAGEHTLETTAGELGLSWSNPEIVEEAAGLGKSGNLIERYKAMKDLEHNDKVYTIGFTVDSMKVAGVLESNLEVLNSEAVDSDLKKEGDEFIIIPGVQGTTVNVEDSVATVENYFTTLWNEEDSTIELVAEIVEPKGTVEELNRVKDVLGSFHTDFSSSAAGRVKNVSNGAERINGSLIYPGEQFSVYEVVSPFTEENGYALAGAYENGQTVESYGGGICQVSTTLYNAAIRAELEIVERHAHSMVVTYVDPSEDAAIAGTYKDLKFINNTDSPIYIEGYTKNKVIYFTIYGHETRDANREVSFVSETLTENDPGTKFRVIEAPIGTLNKLQGSHVGKSAKLWKIVKVNGVETSRELFNTSTYSPSPAIYEVGIASANPEAVAAMQAAIATGDLATVQAAAAAWNDAALAAQQEQQQPTEGEEGTPTPDGSTPTPDGSTPTPDGGTTPPDTTTPDGGATGTN